MIQLFSIVLVCLCLVIPSNVATLTEESPEPISRQSGSLWHNILGERTYKDHIVTSRLDVSSFWVGFYRLFRDTIRTLNGDTGDRTEGPSFQKRLPPSTSFPCRRANQRSATVPDSVHKLRPGDIDIITAMGDSVTVGAGANAVNLIEAALENRGLSFSIGGYGNFRTHLTLPNILKEFNPRLFGYSWGDAFNKDQAAQFNLAENIAATSDMPFMAQMLSRRMRLDRRVNMKSHWKLLTIMIGGNDFCQDICHQKDAPLWTNQEQEENIIKTLRIIRDNMPRTFVNLVTEPLVSLIVSMDGMDDLPYGCQIGRTILCSCLEGSLFSQKRDLYIALDQNYRKIFERVAHRAEFHRNDFTVVFQPFSVNATVFIDNQVPDISIMAYDCIHFSQKGHAVAANALWNNMMQTEPNKKIGLKPLFEEFECPTEDNPYLRTYFNSKSESLQNL